MTQPEEQQPNQQPADQPTPGWPQPTSSPPAATPPPVSPPPPPVSPPPYQPAPPAAPQNPYSPQPAEPVYQPPVDPFNTTTPPAGSPYTAPTYYPAGSAPVPPPPTAPISATPYPYPGHPGYPGGVPVQPPKKRNKGLIITAIVLGVLLVLCLIGGVGAFLLLRDTEGTGKPTAKEAAQGFLTEIYKNNDATKAEKLVCKEARDAKAIKSKVTEVKDQTSKLKSPTFDWDTVKVENETDKRADTTVTIKLTTSDEKVSEQTVKLELVKRDGWFVCEVREQTK